jgi:hypothetical protein
LFLVIMLSWLLILSWPVIPTGSKLIRVFAISLLLFAAWMQLNS